MQVVLTSSRGLRPADLVFAPTLACRGGGGPTAGDRRLPVRTAAQPDGTVRDRRRSFSIQRSCLVRGGQGLPLSRTMLSNQELPYVGRFACDWLRLATTDPGATHTRMLRPRGSVCTALGRACPLQRCPLQRCPLKRCPLKRCPLQRFFGGSGTKISRHKELLNGQGSAARRGGQLGRYVARVQRRRVAQPRVSTGTPRACRALQPRFRDTATAPL
jgi:hypothetical protein